MHASTQLQLVFSAGSFNRLIILIFQSNWPQFDICPGSCKSLYYSPTFDSTLFGSTLCYSYKPFLALAHTYTHIYTHCMWYLKLILLHSYIHTYVYMYMLYYFVIRTF